MTQTSVSPTTPYTYAAVVINHRDVDVIPAISEEAALEYLRDRSQVWEDSSAVPNLERTTATLEQLNLLFSDGDPSPECMVTIGMFEDPSIQSSLLHSSDMSQERTYTSISIETAQQTNIQFLEYIAKTSHTNSEVKERLGNAIVTAHIRIAKNDCEEDKQQLQLLQAVLALVQKGEEA